MTRQNSVVERKRNFEWLFLGLLSLAYLFVFFWHYPPLHGIEDEACYINQAFVWLDGSVSAEGAGYKELAVFEMHRGRNVPWCSPGRSVALLPFWILFGAKAIFASGALIHLLTTFLAAWLLTRLKQSPLWSALVLFHPTLTLYSRTVMSDELAGLLLLAAVSTTLWKRDQTSGFCAGVLIGLAAFTRQYAAVVTPFFILVLWRQKGFRAALACFLSSGAMGVLIAAYNFYIFGNLAGRPVYLAAFSSEYLFGNLIFYVPTLLVIYPLSLLAPFADTSKISNYVRAVCLPVLVLLLFYFFYDTGANALQTAVIGQRFLQIALPVWLVSYSLVLSATIENFKFVRLPRASQLPIIAVICSVLLLGQILIFRQHQRRLTELKTAQDEITKLIPAGALVIANRNLTKLLGTPATGAPDYRWRVYHFLNQPFDHSAEIAREQEMWYLALLPRTSGDELPDTLKNYIAQYQMTRVETADPNLILYRAEPINRSYLKNNFAVGSTYSQAE